MPEPLSHIATTTQPHAAYSAFTHGLVHKWSYLARTVPDITRFFQPLEDVIRNKFIPCLTGRPPLNDLEHKLLSLPPRLGGLGIPNPTATSDTEYTASISVCKPLYNLILLHDSNYPTEAIEQQVEGPNLKRRFTCTAQNGNTARAVLTDNFTYIHKGAFRNAIALNKVRLHGYHQTFAPPAHVESLSLFNTLSLVHKVAFHLFATMRSVIKQLIS